jgi:superfamily II DNA/RNA helicase
MSKLDQILKKLEYQEMAPSSSWSTFELHPDIIKALLKRKFFSPSEVQSKVLLYAKYSVDLIISSKTVNHHQI